MIGLIANYNSSSSSTVDSDGKLHPYSAVLLYCRVDY